MLLVVHIVMVCLILLHSSVIEIERILKGFAECVQSARNIKRRENHFNELAI